MTPTETALILTRDDLARLTRALLCLSEHLDYVGHWATLDAPEADSLSRAQRTARELLHELDPR